jgi:hypothetical protein
MYSPDLTGVAAADVVGDGIGSVRVAWTDFLSTGTHRLSGAAFHDLQISHDAFECRNGYTRGVCGRIDPKWSPND